LDQEPTTSAAQYVKRNTIPVFIATTVMLTFISWVRAAAIVLNDLASSAFYAISIAEQAFGKAAPWFVLGVMFFSFTVRAIYVESCSMFVRGGVYKVVKEALGGPLAKLAVSALMFDYILTGPISGVSAGQYIAGLVNELLHSADLHGWIPAAVHGIFHGTPQLPINESSVVVAVAVTIYFWWQNLKGIEESSDKALKVMKVTTVMVVLLLGWSFYTLSRGHYSLPPWPVPSNLHFTEESLGFLKHVPDLPHIFGVFGIIMAFGHTLLAMSGEESLAQVYREIAHPKLKNLKRAALVIAIYSLLFTGVTALLVVMIVPDNVRMQPDIKDNLLGALVMYLAGPQILKLIFRGFVVVVGFLILAGAINTAIVGSNGVLNRVAEDGVLTDWFRRPHKRYGTTSRMLNLIVGLQLFTIIVSRGDVYVLGEAYAFGVIWSFVFKGLAMLVLRFKYKGERDWKMPVNITIRGVEIPVGMACVTLVLLTAAIVNLLTKSVATVSGLIFSAVFFAIFAASEKVNRRRSLHSAREMKEHFHVLEQETVENSAMGARPGNVLVAVRDPRNLYYLRAILQRTDTKKQDVIVMTARLSHRQHDFSGNIILRPEEMFENYERDLFTRVVAIAEKEGKHVSLLVVPTNSVFDGIVATAQQLQSSRVITGLSNKLTADEQGKLTGDAWERLPAPRPRLDLEVHFPDGGFKQYQLGPHAPRLRPEDNELLHQLWRELTADPQFAALHHYDVVWLALKELQAELDTGRRQELLRQLEEELKRRQA
jgi:amino acid transporter